MSSKFIQIYENSIKNPENFWQEASEDIFWFKNPSKILIILIRLSINGSKMGSQIHVIML